MTQDVSSAADTLEERVKHTVLLKKPSVVHGFAEGGGVLGKMFPVFGNDWEEKTGIPFGLAIHVKEGVSTGLPFMTGISIPDPENPMRPLYSCKDIMRMYDEDCAEMFKQKPRRLFNLLASNGINLAQHFIDPAQSREDRAHIERIKRYCDLLLEEVPEDRQKYVTLLRERASVIWLTKSNRDSALRLFDKFTKEIPANPKKKIEGYKPTEKAVEYVDEIGRLINRRSTGQKGLLRTLFMRSVLFSMDTVKTRLGPRENRYHSPVVKEEIFKMRMKDRTPDQVIGSLYAAAYSPKKNSIVYFYSRRENLLDMSPTAPVAHLSHPGMKLWDINMATTANLLAFLPHVTEEGLLTVDKATIHAPGFVISQTIKYKPQAMGVINITLSTGYTALRDRDDKQIYEFYAENSEVHQHFLDESKSYRTTDAHMDLAERIGEENIFYLSPRMSWKDYDEMINFPSLDITDASPENMAKIERRAEKYLRDKADLFNRLWQTLADNMYLLGHIDKPKFDEITNRLGVKALIEQEMASRNNVVPLHTATAANIPPSHPPAKLAI